MFKQVLININMFQLLHKMSNKWRATVISTNNVLYPGVGEGTAGACTSKRVYAVGRCHWNKTRVEFVYNYLIKEFCPTTVTSISLQLKCAVSLSAVYCPLHT